MPERAQKIMEELERLHPDARIELRFSNPLELLVATILSAQCTDKRVNEVTATLFKRYRTAKDYAEEKLPTFEAAIRPTGFFRMKAKAIQGCCRMLAERFGGQVPQRMEDLVQLPGVGRKTANVILGGVFDTPGIVVDTHVRRVANRLGLTIHDDPDKIEQDLMPLLPRQSWTRFSHVMIFHGRRVCHARKPACPTCGVWALCPFPAKTEAGGTGRGARDGQEGLSWQKPR